MPLLRCCVIIADTLRHYSLRRYADDVIIVYATML